VANGSLVAVGYQSGEVAVFARRGDQLEQICLENIHHGPVVNVTFWSETRLISAGADRRINVAILNTTGLAKFARLSVTIRAEGVRYGGVRGPVELRRVEFLSKRRGM
jgi:hypothetical protein